MKCLNVSFLAVGLCIGSIVSAHNQVQEIELLISAVSESGCTFHRNGFSYSSERAAKHLQMKYSRGKKYVVTTQDFIDVLASKSSVTGKPYTITCKDNETETVRDWLLKKLNHFRENHHEGQM